jgi:amino acid adenylation domain-containing protein
MSAPTRPPSESSLPPSGKTIAQIQRRRFHELLHNVWIQSAFYREFYQDHGIQERDLPELSVTDLPFLTKSLLMAHFDGAVTDSRLRKTELELWLDRVRDARQMFEKDFIVMHSSGSSGTMGIFVYGRTDWQVMNSVMADRLPKPENEPYGRTRVGFYMAAHGHFAGIAAALHLPKAVYDTLIVSFLDPTDRVIEQLQSFHPHRLTGYSSSIAFLADQAIEGRLAIKPQSIFVNGDLLTTESKQKILQAWGAPITNLYGASESLPLAVQKSSDEEMTVMDDLNILEILDERNRSVEPGHEGRVVITNLYNYTLPILRYELGDYVTRGRTNASGASMIQAIRPGKANDALPIALDNGTRDTISPRALNSFYAPGIERAQFVSLADDRIRIDYVARSNIDSQVRNEFQRILNMKGASRLGFEVCRIRAIAADPKTGKVRLVVRDGGQPQEVPTIALNHTRSSTSASRSVSHGSGYAVFNKTEIEQSMSERFERQVEKFPERVAIRTRGLVLTYDALNRAANRVAQAILARRNQGSEPIALLLDQGTMAVVIILGILKAGKFYVPLDPAYPRPWLVAMLDDSGTPLLVTDDANLALARMLTGRPERILNIDDLGSGLPDDDPGLPVGPDALAYLFYTSGSTGQPKGVMQTHCNVLHQIATYTSGLGLRVDDRCTLLHSHGFSASRLDIFGALLNGAELLPFAVGKEGTTNLASWLVEEEATVFHWIPTGFRHLVNALSGIDRFPKVRRVVLGSEPLLARDVDAYKKHFGPTCVLVNRFGTTETGNICWFFIGKDTHLEDRIVPVGYPIADTEVLLLDETGKPVGYDQPGEIVVKSRYLSPGYWRGTDTIGSSFVTDPTASGKRIYRTGDLGSMRPDGCVTHLGRKDLQAKIRGHRIELGQIDSALLRHPAVREAMTVVRQDKPDERRLVAYIVLHRNASVTITALRNFLGAQIPAYMVPADFVQLESMPLTPSGKLNRQSLPEPGAARLIPDAPFAEPISPIERTIAEIWRSALNVARVALHDSFFDLGGHSLLANTVVARMADAFQVEITFRQFFERATVAQLAELIGENLQKKLGDTALANLLTELESLSEEGARHALDNDRSGD